jgi:aminomethyltransferase
MDDGHSTPLRRLPLHDLHVDRGGRMVPFAGWEMPVHYPAGVMAEHLQARTRAALFDVSHMGQVVLHPRNGIAHLAQCLETLVPADIAGLAPGRQRYALLTDDAGGILDDVMVTNRGGNMVMVVNASMRAADLAHLADALGPGQVEEVTSRALLALQGPAAERALSALVPSVGAMRFMDSVIADWDGADLWISRSGYTGEDGFEISVPVERVVTFRDGAPFPPRHYARWLGRARLVAVGSWPAALWRRYRPDHQPGRGEPVLVDR